MKKNIEVIKDKKNILAIVIYNNYKKEGAEFFTPEDFSMQMAFMSYPKGRIGKAHIHKKIKRDIYFTQETLFIRKGRIKINLYDDEKKYFDSRILKSGDIILLAHGGHGSEVLENTEMIEVKQGPYLGKDDKIFLT